MRVSIRTWLIFAAAASLAACAGSMEKTASAPVARAVPEAVGSHQDDAYVAAVERIARRRGIDVHWVNPPDRRGRVAGR